MRLVYKSALALYLIALGFGVFTPRPDRVTPGANPVINGSNGGMPAIGHHILYESGTVAWIGNFFILIPVALLIRKCWPRLAFQTIFIITLLITITIEYIQVYIPGRVSSVSDIIFNGSGPALTLLILHRYRISKNRDRQESQKIWTCTKFTRHFG